MSVRMTYISKSGKGRGVVLRIKLRFLAGGGVCEVSAEWEELTTTEVPKKQKGGPA